MTERRDCLLVDFGGVLTTNVFSSFAAFCTSHGLSADAVLLRFRDDEAVRTLLVELETGRMAEAEFESRFGELLGVEADGLIDRLFAEMLPDEAMIAAVAAARGAGVRTGLISNSWTRRHYDEQLLSELFDALVISGEVGIRKPDPGIYELALERVGRPARRCVFVDDLPGNLKPARELGMATVHHRAAETTLPELEELLGIPLPNQDEKR
jgi:epoxide hydrolase-like predicted phosphatase